MSVPTLATKLGITGTSAALGGLEGFLAGEGVEGRTKDAALVGTLSGFLGYGGEKAVKFVAPKVSEFFQKLKNKATSETKKPRLIPKEKLSAREIREMKEYQDMMDRGAEF